ncbi:glutamine amidotransferase [Aurantivibrio plasticivorans]
MLIGILEAESLPSPISQQFGSYADMFENTLKAADSRLRFNRYAVDKGQLPKSTSDCDAYLITGSRHSAYEELDWITALQEFIQACHHEKRKLVGICFGHQIIAHALSGKVEKSPKGWGIGVATFSIAHAPIWLSKPTESFSILVTHQDQVIDLPPQAEQFATNTFCNNGGYFISDFIFTLQGHPEFSKGYLRFLLEKRRAIFEPEHLKESLQAIDKYKQNTKPIEWLLEFFYYSEQPIF